MGTSMMTGAGRSKAVGINLSRSIGSSALMPIAPNDSANLTGSFLHAQSGADSLSEFQPIHGVVKAQDVELAGGIFAE